MSYVDGFLAAVPAGRKDDYREFSERLWPFFRRWGALEQYDCWGDDVPEGEVTSFPMAVKREEGEVVVFGWIVWPDRATRDAAFEAMAKDAEFSAIGPMPFDGKRMVIGGFETLVASRA